MRAIFLLAVCVGSALAILIGHYAFSYHPTNVYFPLAAFMLVFGAAGYIMKAKATWYTTFLATSFLFAGGWMAVGTAVMVFNSAPNPIGAVPTFFGRIGEMNVDQLAQFCISVQLACVAPFGIMSRLAEMTYHDSERKLAL